MLRRDKPASVAAVFLVLIVAAAILAPVLAPFDPYDNNLRNMLKPPSERIGSARMSRGGTCSLVCSTGSGRRWQWV